ncbi:MAG TPA: hypothetical protein VGF45_20755 [Polyangia bacterium]
MPSSMLVHDTRLAGTAPNIAPNTFKVNGNTQLTNALGWIRSYAKSNRGLTRLSIMCHGNTGGLYDNAAGMSTFDLGFGLQLCREGLNLSNVHLTGVLEGLVDVIILYACGPAHTRPGFRNTAADGQRLCAEIAGWTNAEVIAAVETQYYNMEAPTGFLRRLFRIGPQDIINFGEWEGTVYRFSPDGSISPTFAPP